MPNPKAKTNKYLSEINLTEPKNCGRQSHEKNSTGAEEETRFCPFALIVLGNAQTVVRNVNSNIRNAK